MAFTGRQRLLLAVLPPVATTLLGLLCRTLWVETIADPGACPADVTDGPDIYAFFHRSLLLAAWQYRHRGIHILISSSFDGELIARIVARMGFVPVRGSSSRGGLQGLLRLTSARRAGHKVAITVDGPRGPAGICKPGAVLVARRIAEQGGRAIPISAFHLCPDRAWTLRSWDRFVIPKPFSRVRAAWCAPLLVKMDDPIAEENERLQRTLDHVVETASGSPPAPANHGMRP